MIIEIFEEDRKLMEESVVFHILHPWSKWYRIVVNYSDNIEKTRFNTYVEQQRHCLLCNKRQRMEIQTK